MKLIDKDALVAEIERILSAFENSDAPVDRLRASTLISLLSFIDTLEVKEVDLEKELIKWHKEHFKKDRTFIGKSGFYLTNDSQMDIAKHFFELGVNASNPLTWEDVKLIWTIGDEIPYMPEEDFFKELLKRFKAQKGE